MGRRWGEEEEEGKARAAGVAGAGRLPCPAARLRSIFLHPPTDTTRFSHFPSLFLRLCLFPLRLCLCLTLTLAIWREGESIQSIVVAAALIPGRTRRMIARAARHASPCPRSRRPGRETSKVWQGFDFGGSCSCGSGGHCLRARSGRRGSAPAPESAIRITARPIPRRPYVQSEHDDVAKPRPPPPWPFPRRSLPPTIAGRHWTR